MKILCAPTSPYSSKVRMAARYLELDIIEIRVDTNAGPAILVDNNPLGKIPTLLTDDGHSIFDSIANFPLALSRASTSFSESTPLATRRCKKAWTFSGSFSKSWSAATNFLQPRITNVAARIQ